MEGRGGGAQSFFILRGVLIGMKVWTLVIEAYWELGIWLLEFDSLE